MLPFGLRFILHDAIWDVAEETGHIAAFLAALRLAVVNA
jgi:hypothetical protein